MPGGHGNHAEIERSIIIDIAKELPIADAIFLVLHYNAHHRTLGPGPYCQPILFSESAVHVAEHEAIGWSIRANKLRNEAYSAAEALILKNSIFDQLRVNLEEKNPGFGKISYAAAIGYGVYQVRKRN